MQNIDLICLGKLNAAYCAAGVAEYQKRLSAFCNFRIIELPEELIREKNASAAVIEKALDKEGTAILSHVRKGAAIVAMCVEGKLVSSEDLAAFVSERALQGAGDIAFVIGSSHGLSPKVKQAAALYGLSPVYIRRLCRQGKICYVNAGHLWLVNLDSLARYFEQGDPAPAALDQKGA